MDKNDLISRSALIERLERYREELIDQYNIEMTEFGTSDWEFAADTVRVIINYCIITAPAVDPEELRPRGRWIKSSEIFLFGYEPTPVFMCSKCRSEFCDVVNTIPTMYHYCPHCGAKMKEG